MIDNLGAQAGGQNVAVASFYFDFATKKGAIPTRMLSSLLKQLVFGQEEILGGILRGH